MYFGLKRVIATVSASIIALTALTGSITVSAVDIIDSGQCGETVTWTLDSDGKLTISGIGAMYSPEVEHLKPVEPQLGDYTDTYTYKKYKEQIKEVEIKDGVTAIGFCAFYKLPNLDTIILSKTISEFKGVGIITKDGEPSASSYIQDFASYAFAECINLKNLTLSEGMTTIGGYAFYNCISLESVKIPSTIKKTLSIPHDNDSVTMVPNLPAWGLNSFSGCSSLKNIILPEGLTAIGAHAFANTAVESVIIPSTIETWDQATSDDSSYDGNLYKGKNVSFAFASCKNLFSVTFSDGLKTIGYLPFYNCPKLTKIVIPESVTDIYRAFAYSNVQEVYIANGAKIGSKGFDCAFYSCEDLKTLELSDGILDLGYVNASWNTNCSSLENLYLHGITYTRMGGIPLCNDFFKFHCYTDSSIFSSTSIPNDRKVNIEETISSTWNNLKNTVNKAESLNENDYTPESYQALKDALEEAKKFNESTTSILPMKWASEDITTAINNLVAYDASYTSVDEAIAKADKLDLSKYTDESVKALQDAINAVEKGLDITNQDKVDAFAKAIEDAIKGLVVKKTDSKPNKPNNSGTSKNPNVKPATSVPITTRSPSQVAKDKKNAENKINQAKITNLKAKSKTKKRITVSWKKVKKAVGYEVQVSKTRKFKKALFDKFTTKKKITFKKKLKSGKIYYVRVRAYATYKDAYGKPQKVYSKWIKKVRKVKVK